VNIKCKVHSVNISLSDAETQQAIAGKKRKPQIGIEITPEEKS